MCTCFFPAMYRGFTHSYRFSSSSQVTTTSTQTGKFEARFFHLIFEEEFARVKGHFGPINTIAIHPDGKRSVDRWKLLFVSSTMCSLQLCQRW